MQDHIDATLLFVSEHRIWVLPIAFLLAMAETTVIVALFVPATAILVGIGGLVAAGSVDFLPLFLGAAAGAISGSILSWWIGRRYGPDILDVAPLRRRRAALDRARAAANRWGAGAILLGHFLGPVRAVLFTFVGMSGVSLRRFLPITILGATVWAMAAPMAGQLGGLALTRFF
ncbi:VTT domain-containing protein [Jannaschia sp. S6380]|uniref:DedA family protein n=1 Tax=Jannaschia sp. S6380 TaxID=2926408 RepID=UPI001FF104B7|nr:VTT domain-containing protein [Jannaschia sp. S6380]MCK0167442.1 VTT domain-containing protein [Jannaschia sp. S6380]